MGLIRIDRNPTRRQLATFGVVWFAFFALAGLGAALRGAMGLAPSVWAVAVVVPLLGWMSPQFMRIVYLGMSYLAFPVGFVLSYLILAGVYYLVLTPIGLVLRMAGHDPLQRRFDARAQSYWVERERAAPLQRYFRQY
ncbi:MAG: SxtJ family membrane protein [Pirellulaceae bacterium]|jgi:hypothetical protein|nr:SxtJ family membrane protein [Pirellulaceae bacterium]